MKFYDAVFGNGEKNIAILTESVKEMQFEMNKRIIGQTGAVNAFANGLFSAGVKAMNCDDRKGPLAFFVFAGPSGVGKTLFAESVAECLGMPFERFDMSAYAGNDANVEFSGSDSVYKESKEGNVTSYVRRRRKSVLIFDEIEKANPVVINLFLQILDKGTLRDSKTDEEVSFKDTIIIFTTNAGKQLYTVSGTTDLSALPQKTVLKALEKDVDPLRGVPFFPPAICSRFASGNLIVFNHIDSYGLYRIARREVEKKCAELEKNIGIKMSVDSTVCNAFLFSEGGVADARIISSKVSSFIDTEIFELFRLMRQEELSKLKSINIKAVVDRCPEDIREMLEERNAGSIMLFASREVCKKCTENAPNVDFCVVNSLDEADRQLVEGDVCAALIDLSHGKRRTSGQPLNLEDVDSEARDVMWHIRTVYPDVPLYILGDGIGEEEKMSFKANGVHGVISLDEDFVERLLVVNRRVHCIESMNALARSNRVITFETSQTVSEDSTVATVSLFDFEFDVAIAPEDKESILSVISQPNVRFDDVFGAEEAKKELCYFADYIKNYKRHRRSGVGMPKGVLLYGPSGTGKTMLAKAMAKETGATFISADANSFIKGNIGLGIQKVHEIFAVARKYAPSVIFVDEFDAIAKERVGRGDGTEEVLTAFLTEMDGFKTDKSKLVFVLAATNFNVKSSTSGNIDAAVQRRFDRIIHVGLPNRESRIAFMKDKIKKQPDMYIVTHDRIENIALRSTGMSLAGLDGVFELALRETMRNSADKVTDSILDDAFETFNNGDERKWDEAQLHRVACHEAGHAVVSWISGRMPVYISVAARDGHVGYMQCSDDEGKALYTKEELLSRLRTVLGGRSAELLYYGETDGVSTCASDDLKKATEIAGSMVCDFGMFGDWGIAVVKDSGENAELLAKINEILNTAIEESKRIIEENREVFDTLTDAILKKNCLHGEEIAGILKGGR